MRDNRFNVASRVITPGDILYLRLEGGYTPRLSSEHAYRLGARLAEQGFHGFVADCRPVCFLHTETQFDHLAGLLAHLLPDGLVSAFVYGEAQKPHTIMLVRALQADGALCGAFRNHRDAISWVRDTLTFREVSRRPLREIA